MRKALIVVSTILLLCGCNVMDMNNTPKKQVEKFFNGYQTLNKSVLDDLDNIVNKETTLTAEQKNKYRDILKKHYEDLNYEIKDETINGNNATVKVEIEVNDYSKVLKSVNEHKINYPEEFLDTDGNYSESIFQEYRLNAIKDTKERITYTLYVTLTKINDKWTIDELTNTDEEKILGIYEY